MADEETGPDEEFEDDTPEEDEDEELDGPGEDFEEDEAFADEVDDDEFEGDDDAEDSDDAEEGDDEDGDDEDEERAARARKRKEDDEDDDDEMLAPDDVEADLDAILKDRMVAADDGDEDDEDEEAGAVDDRGEAVEGLQPKRADEQLCNNCFLLVRSNAPGCPIEDDNCPIFG